MAAVDAAGGGGCVAAASGRTGPSLAAVGDGQAAAGLAPRPAEHLKLCLSGTLVKAKKLEVNLQMMYNF